MLFMKQIVILRSQNNTLNSVCISKSSILLSWRNILDFYTFQKVIGNGYRSNLMDVVIKITHKIPLPSIINPWYVAFFIDPILALRTACY